jgi:hypothetical protein
MANRHRQDIDERRERYMSEMKPATHNIITEVGVSEVVNPCNTGGWAEYGFGDEHETH